MLKTSLEWDVLLWRLGTVAPDRLLSPPGAFLHWFWVLDGATTVLLHLPSLWDLLQLHLLHWDISELFILEVKFLTYVGPVGQTKLLWSVGADSCAAWSLAKSIWSRLGSVPCGPVLWWEIQTHTGGKWAAAFGLSVGTSTVLWLFFIFVFCGLDNLLSCLCRLGSVWYFEEEHAWNGSNSFLNSSRTAALPAKEQRCRTVPAPGSSPRSLERASLVLSAVWWCIWCCRVQKISGPFYCNHVCAFRPILTVTKVQKNPRDLNKLIW